MKYSACIELLFSEVSFLERIRKSKENNFNTIEFWDWKGKDLKAITNECNNNEIEIASFVGNTEGQMIVPEDRDRFINGVKKSIEVAKDLKCENLILTTNILRDDRTVEPIPYNLSNEDKRENILNVLKKLAPVAEKAGIVLNVEPLNTIVDHKGYFLEHSKDGFDLVKEVNSKNIRLLYDIYHMQIMEGNILENISNNIEYIGYIHVADVPGRNEPGTGEINYKNVYKKLNDLNYTGFVGFEYIPSKSTEVSLINVKKIFNF